MKMRLILGIVALMVSQGCDSLKKITTGAESRAPEIVAIPDIQRVNGRTIFDFQTVEGVFVADRDIAVRVRGPSDPEFRTLNKYEFKILTGGSIEFKRRANIIGQKIVIYSNPVAPIGTEYEITSIKK